MARDNSDSGTIPGSSVGQRGLLEGARRAGHEHDGQQRLARHPAAGGADRQRRGGKPGDIWQMRTIMRRS